MNYFERPNLFNSCFTFFPTYSDGCGRTGTFLSIYSQIDRLKVEAVVDVFQCVKAARIQRMDLVGTVVRL